MKKLIFCIFLSICSIAIAAQEHLTFKGIPIEGSIDSFCRKLEAKGLKKVYSDDQSILFSGDFTGMKSDICVVADTSGKNVYAVVIILPKSNEWNELVNSYEYFKDLYSEKYGAPSNCVENNPSRRNDNLSLMHEVYQGTVEYKSVYSVPGGIIKLSIEKADGVYEGKVVIVYSDSQNRDKKRQSDLDEI